MAGLHRHGHGQSRDDSLDTDYPGSAYPELLNYDVVEQPPEILWVCSGASGRLQGIRDRFLVNVWSLMFTACSLLLRSALPCRSVHPSSLTDVRAETARPSMSSESSTDVPYRRPGLLLHLTSPPSSQPLGPCYWPHALGFCPSIYPQMVYYSISHPYLLGNSKLYL